MNEQQSQEFQEKTISRFLQPNVHPSVIQIRLQTKAELEEFEMLLRGQVITEKVDETGRRVRIAVQTCDPILETETGVQAVLRWIKTVVNPQVVQGNYTTEWYEGEIERFHKGLARDIVINYHAWGLKKNNRDHLIEICLNLVDGYLSRLVDNLERDSYSQSMRAIDSTSHSGGGGFFNGILPGRK